MYAFPSLASLALLLVTRLALVRASVYVTNPVQSTSCAGGQSCQVQWVDNGESPLLSTIGECEVGLYSGELTLVQSLPSVDVSTTSSFSFTPDPAAGSNGQYYLVFTASSINYQGFSGSFTLTGMSGTGGGSSAPVSTPATTLAGSSTSAGSSTPGTSPTDTATGSSVSAPSGTSSPVTGTTTPTGSTSAAGTTAATTPSASPSVISVTTSPTTITTPTTSKTSTSTSASASASATNAAVRVGSTTSLGGVAALFVLSGVLAL